MRLQACSSNGGDPPGGWLESVLAEQMRVRNAAASVSNRAAMAVRWWRKQ